MDTTNKPLNSTQQEVNWESRLLAKHQKEWRLTSCLVGSGVVREQDLWQAGVPVLLSRHRQSTQQIVKGAVETLALTIASRMVWSGARFLNAIEAAKLLDQGGFKIPALVRMKTGRDTGLRKPFRD